VLGLAEKVGGAEFAVDGLVSDDQGFGGAGEEIDTDAAVELALGFGDEGVARADQHVDGLDALGADGHGADRLDAAEHVDLVRAGHVLGDDDRRSGLAAERWGGGDDALAPGDLGSQHRHVSGGEQRVFAAGDVAADIGNGDVLMAEGDAGQRLHLQRQHRILLLLREVPYLRLSEGDVGQVLVGELGVAGIDFGLAQAEVGPIPTVELARKLSHGFVAALLDIGEDGFDGEADLLVGFRAFFHRLAGLEPPGHGILLSRLRILHTYAML
jgi:hypothetical protein